MKKQNRWLLGLLAIGATVNCGEIGDETYDPAASFSNQFVPSDPAQAGGEGALRAPRVFLATSGAAEGLGNVSSVTRSGDTLTLSIGTDKLLVQVAKPEILRVDYRPNGSTSSQTLVLDPAKSWSTGNTLSIDTASNPMVVKTSKMQVKIQKSPCRISIYDASGSTLLIKDQDTKGVVAGGLYLNHATGVNFYGIHGFDVEANGSVGVLRNRGGAVMAGAQGHTGAPLVFTKEYGLLVDSDGGRFDITGDALAFTGVSRTNVEYYLIVSPPKQTMQAFAEISGRPPMFPKWAMGFLHSEWGTDETEVNQTVTGYRSRGLPIDAFILDFDWKAWGEDNYGEWRWNSTSGPGNLYPNKFPNGASGSFAASMASKGIKLAGIMKPRIFFENASGQPTQAAQYATDRGFWYAGRDPYYDYFSQRLVRDLDFSITDCRRWYWDRTRPLLSTGIVGYWNDEADGFDNFQFLNMQRMFYEGQRSASSKRVWSLNRNFYLGSQRYAYANWSGDIRSGFFSMSQQRERMLSSINTGGVKWGMDSGGHQSTPSNENYARWLQFSAFTPVFRVHGTLNETRKPWDFGTVAEAATKAAMLLRYRLLPYIYAYERIAYESGLGIVRPLHYEFPEDANVVNYNAAWMFGDAFLVAPVMEQGQTSKSIYLPSGTYYDYLKGKAYAGGQIISYSVNASTWTDIPLFAKKGAIIPFQDPQNYVGEKSVSSIDLDVFPDTVQTSFTYYDDDGATYGYESGAYFKQAIKMIGTASNVTLTLDAKTGSYSPALRSYLVRIHRRKGSAVMVNGTTVTKFSSLKDLQAISGEGWATTTDIFGDVVYVKVNSGVSKKIVVTGAANTDPTNRLEAESATLAGGARVATSKTGFTGTGYVEGFSAVGASASFSVSAPSAGTYDLMVRYALGSSAPQTLTLYLNGTKQRQTKWINAFAGTWLEKSERVTLKSGTNTIQFRQDAGDTGAVSLDHLNLVRQVQTYQKVRIKNRWTNSYLAISGDTSRVTYLEEPGTAQAAQWMMETGPNGIRLKNAGTGTYMHGQSQTGYVQAGSIDASWLSAQWALEQSEYIRIKNVGTGKFIHLENKTGYAQLGDAPDYWHSADWMLEPIY